MDTTAPLQTAATGITFLRSATPTGTPAAKEPAPVITQAMPGITAADKRSIPVRVVVNTTTTQMATKYMCLRDK